MANEYVEKYETSLYKLYRHCEYPVEGMYPPRLTGPALLGPFFYSDSNFEVHLICRSQPSESLYGFQQRKVRNFLIYSFLYEIQYIMSVKRY